MKYLGYSDHYSVITEFRHEKGKRLFQLREYMQGDDFGLLTAISDGSRNPDMSRFDWQEIECMSLRSRNLDDRDVQRKMSKVWRY